MIQLPIGRFWSCRTLAGLRERGLPLLLGCFALLAACRQEPHEQGAAPQRSERISAADNAGQGPAQIVDGGVRAEAVPARELSWRFAEGPFGPTQVVVSVPALPSPAVRLPVLIAFHGREQTVRDSKRGARAWLDDYGLGRATERLQHPPLGSNDFEELVSSARLAQINQALQAEPYAGVIVVCPFLPDVLSEQEALREGQALADFIVERVLPRVQQRTPALAEPAATGVDGISLGGRAALLVGLLRPQVFGGVSALQPALGPGEVQRFAELGRSALQQNPALKLRLVTSPEDVFAAPIQALSADLAARGARHSLLLARGTHGAAFTRGPGALEMLLFHSRVLRGLPEL